MGSDFSNFQTDGQGQNQASVSHDLSGIPSPPAGQYVLEMFRAAVEDSTDAVGFSTPQGRHWYQNAAFDRLFGRIGEDPPANIYLDEKVGREVFATIMAGGKWSGEVRMRGAGGQTLDVHLRAYAIKDQGGRVLGLVGVHNDITQQKLAQKNLQHRNGQLAALNRLGREMNGALSPGRVVEIALDGLARVAAPDQAFIFLREEQGLLLKGRRLLEEQPCAESCPEGLLGECLISLVRQNGQAAYRADLDGTSSLIPPQCRQAGMKSLAALPLARDREIVGVIGLVSRTARDFQEESEVLETLAAQVSVALASARLFGALEQELAERRRAEQALLESENRFRVLSEHSPLGISLIDRQGRYEYLNPAFVAMFGYDLGDIPTGEDWFRQAFPDPANRREIKQVWMLDLKTVPAGQSRRRSYRVTCKNGQEKHVLFRPVSLATGRHFVLYEDITERQRAEEEIRNNENTLRTILRASPAGIGMISYPKREILWVNERMSRMTGYASRELIGESLLKLYAEEHEHLRVGRYVANRLEHGQSISQETRWLRKDGNFIDVLTTSAPLDSRDPGKGLVFSALDITENKRDRAAAMQSEMKYRQILESLPDPVLRHDMQGRVLYLNPAFTRVLGWTMEDLAGGLSGYVPADETPSSQHVMRAMQEGKKVGGYETHRLTKDGRTLDIWLNWSLWRDEAGRPAGSVIILRDVTEQKKTVAQLEQARKMEAVGTLAGGIAHDFNNVLQAISGNVQLLLLKPGLAEGMRQALSGVDELAQRAAEMVQQLLTISRKRPASLAPTALNRQIERLCRLIERIIPRMINIRLDLDDALWTIDADQAQLEQIILNLVNNAVDAMPRGGRLTIETSNLQVDGDFSRDHPELAPGPHVLLTVSDSGDGVPPEALPHIFDPFFTTKPQGRGTGLGLATVYGIAKQHNGLVTCASKPGRGTSFHIYLPARPDSPPLAQPSQPDRAEASECGGVETILVVDDEAAILAMAREILEMHGYRVLTATSGEEALEVHRRTEEVIDLVILDLNMPGMGGQRCLEALMSASPDARVVISSGYSNPAMARGLQQAGAAGFLAKPYRLADMVQQVRRFLDQDRECLAP